MRKLHQIDPTGTQIRAEDWETKLLKVELVPFVKTESARIKK